MLYKLSPDFVDLHKNKELMSLGSAWSCLIILLRNLIDSHVSWTAGDEQSLEPM